MEKIYKCPECGETRKLTYEYDYTKQHRPVTRVCCIECGEVFDGDMPASQLKANSVTYVDFPTKPGFVERRMAQMREINDHQWNNIYDLYDGTSDLHDFIDWLKQNYIAPEKI